MVQNIIVVYDYAFINGGAAKIAIKSAIALSKLNYNVYFYAGVGPIDEELKSSCVHIRCLNINDINTGKRLSAIINGVWNKSVYSDFRSFLASFDTKTTVVHFHGWVKALSVAPIKVATKKGFKTFVTLHDYFTLCPNGGFYNYKKNEICKLKGFCHKCFFTNCDKRNYVQKIWRSLRQCIQDIYVRRNKKIIFISISELNEALIKSNVKSKQFFRVNNFVDIPSSNDRDATASKIFIYVGRISEEKGVELYADAISRCQNNGCDISGWVVGKGELYETLKSKYQNLVFWGWKGQNEISELLTQARVLVLPSKWYEAAPLTIMEAMVMDIPCIVSDATAATELIKNEESGFIFKSQDVADLCNTITKSIDDKLIGTIQNNIRCSNLKELFSIETHISTLVDIYERTILNN